MRSREPLLGTRAAVAVTGLDDDAGERIELAILDAVARLEPVFSVFDEASDLWAMRRTGHTGAEDLQAVVELAEHWRATTGGAFCPTLAPLIDLWNRAEDRGRRPDSDELARAVADAAQGRPEHLDLNAIAKGWIADQALAGAAPAAHSDEPAMPSGSRPGAEISAWLSLGGDLVHRGAGSVVVGIEDPQRPYDNAEPMARIDVANEAVATSGGGRRWWTIDGTRYAKVLDPRTGEPTHSLLSATVVAATAATADVLATTALTLGPVQAAELVRREGGEFFFVLPDGSVESSSDRFRRA